MPKLFRRLEYMNRLGEEAGIWYGNELFVSYPISRNTPPNRNLGGVFPYAIKQKKNNKHKNMFSRFISIGTYQTSRLICFVLIFKDSSGDFILISTDEQFNVMLRTFDVQAKSAYSLLFWKTLRLVFVLFS